ncbi:hypothetical protein O3P69_017522 [Scylla paramamosain]|uniref:Uncharacterized protein n=1 Tax=Scylla paramamosain TaxID=85552 RepID=A0AAW0TXF2_SCYPA
MTIGRDQGNRNPLNMSAACDPPRSTPSLLTATQPGPGTTTSTDTRTPVKPPLTSPSSASPCNQLGTSHSPGRPIKVVTVLPLSRAAHRHVCGPTGTRTNYVGGGELSKSKQEYRDVINMAATKQV